MSHRIRAWLSVNAFAHTAPWPKISDLTGLIDALERHTGQVFAHDIRLISRNGDWVGIANAETVACHGMAHIVTLLKTLAAADDDEVITHGNPNVCYEFRAGDIVRVHATVAV